VRSTARALHLIRRAVEWALALSRRAFDAARLLPPRVAIFYVAALVLAVLRADRWTLDSATRPGDLAILLRLATGARTVAEVGTGPGWTTLGLALADSNRKVVSFEVEPRPVDRYARLAAGAARNRVTFVQAAGAEGAATADPVDFLFIDSSHEYEETLDTFSAWRPKLTRGAVVVFHDYGNPRYPGIASAIADLGLNGEATGDLYVWRNTGV
jgi:predicted O-methyltransferase YrrM